MMHYFTANYISNMQMFSVVNDAFLSHFFHVLWSCYLSFHLVEEFIIYFVLHIYRTI